VINRDSIQRTLFKKGIKGLTRARFEVYFRESSEKIKKRLIMLPGSLTGGDTETDIAIKIMKEEGLNKNDGITVCITNNRNSSEFKGCNPLQSYL